jgi:hypothetical protein
MVLTPKLDSPRNQNLTGGILTVDSARDAVVQLEVHLGNGVLGVDGGIRDVTCPRSQF